MDFWNQILLLIFTPAATITALTFIIKAVVKHGLNRELERFRSELQIQVVEFQTKFSIIHEKRVHIIDELYRRIEKSTRLMHDLVSPIQFVDSVRQLPEKRSDTSIALYELDEYFQQNRLYLDKELCNMMDAFLKKANHSIGRFNLTQHGNQYQPDDSGMWIKAWEEINGEVQPIRNELEKQFRELLQPKQATDTNK